MRTHYILGAACLLGLLPAFGLRSARAEEPDVAVCNTLLERYRPLASAHPGDTPLRALAVSGKAGVNLVETGEVIDGIEGLKSWAGRQKPVVSISEEVSQFFEADSGGLILRAPGVPFFMLPRNEGALRCDDSRFFVIKKGVLLPAENPFGPAEEGSCDMSSSEFVSLDSTPLYVQENYDSSVAMDASLAVATWRSDHFGPACSISLAYVPRISTDKSQWGEARCEGSGCEQMRKAAFQLVQRKVFSDLSEDSLLKKLSGKQRDAYKEARSVAENTGDPHASEDREFVPYVLDGKVYVARIADVAFGERDLADQSIKFEQLQEGKMVERAAFSFTVVKGDLVDSSVSPASAK